MSSKQKLPFGRDARPDQIHQLLGTMSSQKKLPFGLIFDNQTIKTLFVGIFFLLTFLSVGLLPAPLIAQSLLQQSDLVYQGAIRVPHGSTGGSSFDYGGLAMAFNPAGNGGAGSLFVTGHVYQNFVSEISIPTPINTTDLNSLTTATVLQNFADVTDGKLHQIPPTTDTFLLGGLLVYNGNLLSSAYDFYDANNQQALTHFNKSSLILSTTGNASGAYQVGPNTMAGHIDGYMAIIPSAYQSSLGKPVLTGNCCLSIISRTSFGPAVYGFDPADLGVTNPVPAIAYLDYPSAHKTLGDCTTTGNTFNCKTEIHGVVFPVNTRSILFWGRQGTGTVCYGEGTSNQSLAGQPTPDGSIYCYDPADGSKGYHAFPYQYQIWAYDVNDFVSVKNGSKNPWDITPYGLWTFTLPFQDDGRRFGGVAYDATNQKIYVLQLYGDQTGSAWPVVHAWKVQASTSTSPPPSPPTTPSNLIVQ